MKEKNTKAAEEEINLFAEHPDRMCAKFGHTFISRGKDKKCPKCGSEDTVPLASLSSIPVLT